MCVLEMEKCLPSASNKDLTTLQANAAQISITIPLVPYYAKMILFSLFHPFSSKLLSNKHRFDNLAIQLVISCCTAKYQPEAMCHSLQFLATTGYMSQL